MLFQQDKDRSDVDEAEESFCQLIVTSGDPAELLNFLPEALNQVTFFIEPPIAFALNRIGNTTWNVRDCAETYQPINKLLTVITSVGIDVSSL